jgi:hypothetical protein
MAPKRAEKKKKHKQSRIVGGDTHQIGVFHTGFIAAVGPLPGRMVILLQTSLLRSRRPRCDQPRTGEHPYTFPMSTAENDAVVADSDASDETGAYANLGWQTPYQRKHAQSTRPFNSWVQTLSAFPNHLEVERIRRLQVAARERTWSRRRAHAPCDIEVPREWAIDALYFRGAEETEYCERLQDLRELPGTSELSAVLVCFSDPWVPFRWPAPQTTCEISYKHFSPAGDLPDSDGGESRKSACGTYAKAPLLAVQENRDDFWRKRVRSFETHASTNIWFLISRLNSTSKVRKRAQSCTFPFPCGGRTSGSRRIWRSQFSLS